MSVSDGDRADLLAEVAEAAAILGGWADRLAVTPGPDARFLRRELDAAALVAHRATGAIATTYRLPEPPR